MKPNRRDDYLAPYRDAVARHGAGFAATLWNSAAAQQVRFEVMIEMAGFADAVVLDAGCGSGDFAAALIEREVPFARYVGIDGIAAQVERAASRGLPRCEFHVGDFVHDAAMYERHGTDYACFSGSLNNMDDETVRSVIAAAFEGSKRGVILNFLSNRAPKEMLRQDARPARRFDTLQMIDFALDLSPHVSFRHDYLDGHDATVLVARGQRPEIRSQRSESDL